MNTTRSFGNYFLSYNTGNNGAPVPQEFVNTQSGESISILLGANLPNNQFPRLNGFAAQQAMLGYQGF
jgi:hypothetical protein